MDGNILGLEQRIETLISECKHRLACGRLEKIVSKLRTLEDQ